MGSVSVQVQQWIDRLNAGDEAARQGLLHCACDRLRQLTRKTLRRFPRVQRWEQTDDVFQNASLRLYRTLAEVSPASAADFFRLAALNIRRELLDLVKHYYGPRGLGARHQSAARGPDTTHPPPAELEPAASGDGPGTLAQWTEFHTQIERLPDEERQLFDLLWYQGLAQAEAATLLGISHRTLKRRWAAARINLHKALGGMLPGT